MMWKTKISKSDNSECLIRGYDLKDLIKNASFSTAIYLILKGELPSKEHSKMLDAILVSSIDHGISPPSIIAARSVASGGNSLNASVAAGVSALGDYHGGAIESCAKLLVEGSHVDVVVRDAIKNKVRLGGFGHKVYKNFDPRTIQLFELAKELGLFSKYCERALEFEKSLEQHKGRKLCLNIDGAIAALMLEMGFEWTLGKAFFIIARAPGICAHVHEELTTQKPFRRLEKSSYEGKSRRSM